MDYTSNICVNIASPILYSLLLFTNTQYLILFFIIHKYSIPYSFFYYSQILNTLFFFIIHKYLWTLENLRHIMKFDMSKFNSLTFYCTDISWKLLSIYTNFWKWIIILPYWRATNQTKTKRWKLQTRFLLSLFMRRKWKVQHCSCPLAPAWAVQER